MPYLTYGDDCARALRTFKPHGKQWLRALITISNPWILCERTFETLLRFAGAMVKLGFYTLRRIFNH